MKQANVRAATIPARVTSANDNGVGADPFTASLMRLRQRLQGYAMFLTQNRAAAEDLVQETLERALLNRRQFEVGSNLNAWITSIMRSRFVDERRRAVIRRRITEVCPPPAPAPPADLRLELLCVSDVDRALAALSFENRLMFRLAYLEGWSYRRLSTRFGIPVNTVGTRLRRARLAVRDLLEQTFRARVGALEPLGEDPE